MYVKATSAVTLGEFDPETIAIVIVVVATTNCVLCISVVVERDKSKCRRTSRCLQINIPNLSVPVEHDKYCVSFANVTNKDARNLVAQNLLVEKVIKFRFPDIPGKVPDVDSISHDRKSG